MTRYLFSFILVFLVEAPVFSQTKKTDALLLKWELGYNPSNETGSMKWIPATVPGAVQRDIAKADNYGLWYYAENWKNYLWMEDQQFTYKTYFKKPEIQPGEHLFFISRGIDYCFDIFFNGERVLQQEGMFTPVKLDLTGMLKPQNEIKIFIHPIPKSVSSPSDRNQANRSVKPAVSYGWDWHPRLVPSGIWDETGLFVEPESALNEVQLDYSLNDSLDYATLILSASGRNLIGNSYLWSLTDRAGNEVLIEKGDFHGDNLSIKSGLSRPVLWWPHDQGDPSLYTFRFQLFDKKGNVIQEKKSSVGFRRVRLVTNTGSTDPAGFPKSRILPPIQLEINGRRIFCKGTNWVNPEVFPGIITAARYKELIDRAIEANFNIFRVWGGGIINKESFYEFCDEKGVLVWQEFPLSCNNYPDELKYLQILEQESTSIIKRLKKHASLVLWCGGNELFNSWGGMNDQSLALRLLNSQCLKYDPTTPFIPTSPIEGVGHGNYVFRTQQTGQEVFEIMKRAHFTAYTEFGIPSPASVEVLKSIIPVKELWPPEPGTSWESHHAYNAWGKNTWLMQDMIEDYFGKSSSLEELVAHGQLLQGEGYKCIYEEARRQKPYCAMAINWCYNEPWPTAANNSLISYPNIPKPGFYQVRNACRPVLASATISKFKWLPGELFKTRVWILSDKPEKPKAGKLRATILSGDRVLVLGIWDYQAMEPNTNLKGPEFSVILPDLKPGTFKLMLEVEDSPELNSEYTMIMSNPDFKNL
jgi:beta-mannosidase